MPSTFQHSLPGRCSERRARAFTLTELLIVMGIIAVVVSLAVPAYNFITGARSAESATNIIASMLGQARSMAVAERRHVGILIYRDEITTRTMVRLVARETSEPPDSYNVWYNGSRARIGDRIAGLVRVDNDNNMTNPRRVVTRKFRCIQDNTTASPPTAGNSGATVNGTPGRLRNAAWEEIYDNELILVNADPVSLPTGVGAQLITESRLTQPVVSTPRTGYDRYVRTGVIFFDPRGQFVRTPFAIIPDPDPASLWSIFFPGVATPGTSSPPAFRFSQFGVVLYDLNLFNNANTNFNDTDPVNSSPFSPPTLSTNERNEETWLDENTTVLLVSRTTGQLVKGE